MKDKLYYHLKKPIDVSRFPEIKGYDFDQKFDFDEFVNSFSTTGIQATNLGSAISITNTMIREKVPIFLSFTSNMISSGVRDVIKFLAKNKMITAFCTSAGGVEEDITQALLPHRLGNFDTKGEQLFEAGIGRIGNIYTTNEHYTHLEFFMREVFDALMKEGTKICPSEMCKKIGELLEKHDDYNHKSSYLYWAYKNNIPVYCPGIIDGAIGDMSYFYKKGKKKEFYIDVTEDHIKLIDSVINSEKTGAIILGGGTPKHYILNANIFREGLDYAVFISTSQSFDASDSGGNQEEAISWAKIKTNALRAKVYSEASIAFPILVAASFAKKS